MAADEFIQGLSEKLAKIASLGRERSLRVTGYAPERGVLDLSTNDYLALRDRVELLQALSKAFEVGTCSSRLLSGTRSAHAELECELAEFFGAERALVFGSGYLANVGVCSALIGRNDVVFSDKLIHASLIDGIELSRAKHFRFRHADINHLASLLSQAQARRKPSSRFFIVSETVFSMDGDVCDVSALASVSAEYDACLILDEAHAWGVMGPGGRGVAFNAIPENINLVRTGTLSKAFGSYGGVVLCSEIIQRYLISSARPLIFNTALPVPLAFACLAALNLIRDMLEPGEELLCRAKLFRSALSAKGINFGTSNSQIVPIIIGESRQALFISECLKASNVIAPAIRPPTVPDGTSRLRCSLTLRHSERVLADIAEIIADVMRTAGTDNTPYAC